MTKPKPESPSQENNLEEDWSEGLLAGIFVESLAEIRATVAAEISLLHARGQLAEYGFRQTLLWMNVAVSAATAIFMALILGMILVLEPHIGAMTSAMVISLPLLALLIIALVMVGKVRRDIYRAFGLNDSKDNLYTAEDIAAIIAERKAHR